MAFPITVKRDSISNAGQGRGKNGAFASSHLVEVSQMLLFPFVRVLAATSAVHSNTVSAPSRHTEKIRVRYITDPCEHGLPCS